MDVLKAKFYFLLIALILLPLLVLSQLSSLLFCEHQPLEVLLSLWGEPFKASTSLHSCVVRAARWFINPQSRGYCSSTNPCEKSHVGEQSQEGTKRTQRICSTTSSSKKGHSDSSKMHKLLLQSNKLHFWVSWHFVMVWLMMVRKASKKQLQSKI